jgi:hypothetical protein
MLNPRKRITMYRSPPAIRVREAISVTGGIVATPVLIKVYDAPQSVASMKRSPKSTLGFFLFVMTD